MRAFFPLPLLLMAASAFAQNPIPSAPAPQAPAPSTQAQPFPSDADQPGEAPAPSQPQAGPLQTRPAAQPANPADLPDTNPNPFTLKASTSLVFVPAEIQTKKGEIIFDLKPAQFTLTDNGTPVAFRMEQDTDSIGLALVVVVQCSRAAYEQFNRMQGLAAMIDDVAGGGPREVAVVQYGTEPQLIGRFTANGDRTDAALARLQPCEDAGAATLDAVNYAAHLFDDPRAHSRLTPTTAAGDRRAILLIGETRDYGSHTRPAAVVAELGRSNIVVDAVSFNPGKSEVVDSLIHGRMGPGPIGLLIMAVQALRRNVPHTLASLTGGEYTNFTTQKGFDRGIGRLANHIHNYYLLSFTPPADAAAGLHHLEVKVPDYPDAQIRSRLTYYAGQTPPPEVEEK